MQYPALRSQKSETRCYLRFANLTQRSVNLVWVNFTEKYVSYKILHPGQFIDVNTFKTHPWIAFDTDTKDKMHLNKKFVYDPQTFREYCTDNFPQYRGRQDVESRVMVRITLPVHTLKNTVLLYLKDCFDNPSSIDHLDLPRLLSETLKVLIQEKYNLETLPLFIVSASS